MAQDAAYYRSQAERCRRLAKACAEREARILNDMAAEYEAKAAAPVEAGRLPQLQDHSLRA
jgi:hypothetical protein